MCQLAGEGKRHKEWNANVFGRYSDGLKGSDSLATPRIPASRGSLYVGQGIAIRQIVT